MLKFAILIALVATAAAGPLALRTNPLFPTGRIIGGVDTTISAAPYQVGIKVLGSHSCGGSIISEYWVLTAAHCLEYTQDWYILRTGSTYSNSGGSTHTVKSIVYHDDYYENILGVPHDDIGLIQSSSAFSLGSTRAIVPLYNDGEEAVADTTALITGWGYLTESGSLSETLQAVELPIVSKTACNASYSIFGGIPARQICAGLPEGTKDACGGDSGGPLVIGGRLAGIVSWGNGCARAGYPGVYTEVASYRKWISKNSGSRQLVPAMSIFQLVITLVITRVMNS